MLHILFKYMFFEDDLPEPHFTINDNIHIVFFYLLVLFILQYYGIINS